MTPTTATLASWLLARIAEDEAVARAAIRADGVDEWVFHSTEPMVREGDEKVIVVGSAVGSPCTLVSGVWEVAAVEHIARHDPARVLAECAAKRRIVDRIVEAERSGGACYEPISILGRAALDALQDLASVYADHPEFQEEWRA